MFFRVVRFNPGDLLHQDCRLVVSVVKPGKREPVSGQLRKRLSNFLFLTVMKRYTFCPIYYYRITIYFPMDIISALVPIPSIGTGRFAVFLKIPTI
jgi:hypothetical protein